MGNLMIWIKDVQSDGSDLGVRVYGEPLMDIHTLHKYSDFRGKIYGIVKTETLDFGQQSLAAFVGHDSTGWTCTAKNLPGDRFLMTDSNEIQTVYDGFVEFVETSELLRKRLKNSSPDVAYRFGTLPGLIRDICNDGGNARVTLFGTCENDLQEQMSVTDIEFPDELLGSVRIPDWKLKESGDE